MKYEMVQKRFPIPPGSTADTVADQVRQILSMKANVLKIVISAGTGQNGSGEIIADILAPPQGPPHGQIEESDPESVWDLLDRVKLETAKVKKPRIRLESIRFISSVMMDANRRGRAPLAWLVRSSGQFARWLGAEVPSGQNVTQFLGLPVVEVARVQGDQMIMLCGRSKHLDPLKAEWGYVMALDMEVSDVGEEAVSERGAGTDQA